MSILYHQFYAQELGFRRGGVRGAGGYMYVVKKAVDAGIFPRLSSSVLNPSQALVLRSPNIPPTVCQFVYNNDKVIGVGSRRKDEYRLNLHALARSHSGLFSPGRIARITKHPLDSNTVIMEFLPLNSKEHARIAKLVGPRNHNHIASIDPLEGPNLVESDLILGEPQIEERGGKVLLKDLLEKPMIDLERLKKIRMHGKISRNPAFRPLVVQAYENRCAFSGLRIGHGPKASLTAAHIYPVALGGSDNPRNGLALSRDLHWAFDNGAISVAEDLTLMIHEQWELFEVAGVEAGKKIFLPEDRLRHPFKEAFTYHRESIFGSFLI